METKANTGAIFKNDKKTAENHPDYKGKINVEGKDFDVALWLKESKAGMKYFSVSISEPYVAPQQTNHSEGREALKKTIIRESGFDNDDLPF